MAYLLAPIPYFKCLVRREYLRDMKDGHGQFLEATAIAVLCVRGDSLHFQIVLHEPLAGCAFTVPIEALVTRPVAPAATKVVQPWDCFSSDFGVCELTAVRRGAVNLIKDETSATYLFTIAFTGSDLADDPAQRKFLHVVARQDGHIGAYPNNRCVFIDRALFGDLTDKPDFLTLTKEFRAEGVVAKATIEGANGSAKPQAAPLNGVHSDPKERPDWIDARPDNRRNPRP